MKLPRPFFWNAYPMLQFRKAWHRAGLPCLLCKLEGRGWRP